MASSGYGIAGLAASSTGSDVYQLAQIEVGAASKIPMGCLYS